MNDHRKLRAFELADELVLAVYSATKSFPREEQFGLTSQMRRAAISIACNIVEGCGRSSLADYTRFLDMSLGSTRELEYQITLAERLDYMSGKSSSELTKQTDETGKVLAGLIKSLRQKR